MIRVSTLRERAHSDLERMAIRLNPLGARTRLPRLPRINTGDAARFQRDQGVHRE